jgi:hypothetical protein
VNQAADLRAATLYKSRPQGSDEGATRTELRQSGSQDGNWVGPRGGGGQGLGSDCGTDV